MATSLRLLVVLLVAVAASGPASPRPSAFPRRTAYVPPARSCAGKPAPPIGRVALHVAERPAPDRAVLVARATPGPLGDLAEDARLDLVLPEGAFVVEGGPESVHAATWLRGVPAEGVPSQAVRSRAGALTTGGGTVEVRWTVQFPVGAPLDAVARLSATSGSRPGAVEAAVPLAP